MALKSYEEAIKRNKNEAKYYCNRGICYIKLIEFSLALKDFVKTLELDENYIKAYPKKGNAHFFLKEYHKA